MALRGMEVALPTGMESFRAFGRSLKNPYTYNLRRNSFVWLGMFWGLLIPCFVYALDVSLLAPGGKSVIEAVRANPTHAFLFLQPLVLGILFGAAGTVRHELELENRRLVLTLRELAMTDALTGLHNRRYIQGALKAMKETAGRTGHRLFVVLLDLDGFKAINDREGHVRGDAVLCAVAESLKTALRQSDVLGRHGGDEFIFAGLGDRQSASRLLERAAAAVRTATGLGFSFGVACWPEDGSDAEALIAAADRSLGGSKRTSHESRTLPRVPPVRDSA
jgi:diguanylate cyclase (GGDEF)-like protein